MASNRTPTPAHLTPATRRWFRSVIAGYQLEPHHVKLLTAAAEAWDRLVEARKTIEDKGMFYTNRFNEPRAHPALAVERDSRLGFARLVREIGLADEDAPDSRPQSLRARYKGRR